MSEEPEAPRLSEIGMLRVEMRAGFQSMNARLDGVNAHLIEHDQQFLSHDKQFVSLEARIAQESAVTRRHFDVVAEGLRADLKVVIDKTTATGKKLDRLITSNAIEHAAILDAVTNHEVRITTLEKTADATRTR